MGMGCRLQVTGYKLQVTSYRLQVTGCKLQVASYRLQVTGCRLQVTGYRLSAAEDRSELLIRMRRVDVVSPDFERLLYSTLSTTNSDIGG
jgi:hypothetical protein